MGRTIVGAVLVVLLSVGSAPAFEIGIRGAYWVTSLSGDVRFDGAGRGDTLDWKDDLGVGDENPLFGDAWIQLGRHHLTVSGIRVDYSGTETLASVAVGGRTFTGKLDTSLKYTMLDLAYRYDLIDLENFLAGFSVGPVLQGKYLDGEAEVTEVSTSTTESNSFSLPVPLVGVGGHVGLIADLVELRFRAVGISYSGDRILDAVGEVLFSPVPFVEVSGGYRYLDIDVDDSGLALNYTQKGLFAGLSLKF